MIPPRRTADIAVIGGSGLYALFSGRAGSVTVDTPYGPVGLSFGEIDGRTVVFIPRHGADHSVAPHRIEYRANIWALAAVGVRAIVSTAAVGAVDPDYPVDSFALVDQYIDRTHGRADTFFDGSSVQHLGSADPFCPTLLAIARDALAGTVQRVGTVVVIQGPRFSTRAESRWFRAAGAHLVNMTLYPEVPLAAELGIGTVTLAYITDNDAAPSEAVTAEKVFARLAAAQPRIIDAVERIVAGIPADYEPRRPIAESAVAEVMARTRA